MTVVLKLFWAVCPILAENRYNTCVIRIVLPVPGNFLVNNFLHSNVFYAINHMVTL